MSTPLVRNPPSYPYWTYQNRHLTPGVRPYWSYDNDSFSWNPKPYKEPSPSNSSLTADYQQWLKHEKTVLFPLMTRRGGMTENQAIAIQDGTMNFPDLKSTTLRNTAFFQQIVDSLPTIRPYMC
jgi:hypothetical protein